MSFFNQLEEHAQNIALLSECGQTITYQELAKRADRIGHHIESRSLVFILVKNNIESLSAYVGVMRSGSVAFLIDESIDKTLLGKLCSRFRPHYIYAPGGSAAEDMPTTEVDASDGYTLMKNTGPIDYALDDRLALLLTTSGSTGSPKLVRQSYENIDANAAAIVDYLDITSNDRVITTMPMYYTYGLSIIHTHLLMGATIVLNEATLMEKAFWERLKAENVTSLNGVPYVYEMLNKLRFDKQELPHLKYMTQAGGRLNPELTKYFVELCVDRGIKFYTMYGQSEATARMSFVPWNEANRKTGSIGRPIPGGEFWLETEDGRKVLESETVGELVYRGPNVTMGYADSYDDLAKGDENEGVLHTGDLARRDADDFYYVVGRKKRFLKLYGSRVNLDEVEELLGQQGWECICAGEDDFLRIYTTKEQDKEAISTYVAQTMKIHRQGFSCSTIDVVPRNNAGKILYAELEKRCG